MLKLKILIIDDEADYCAIMKSYFQAKQHLVSLATTLREGLEALEKIQPDILILDNNLPDGTGWEHVGDITAKMPSLKIYLISAHHQKPDFAALSNNITIWEKPISFSLLEKIL